MIAEREAIGFAAPRECKTFANPRECNKFRQFDENFESKFKNSVKLTGEMWFLLIWRIFMWQPFDLLFSNLYTVHCTQCGKTRKLLSLKKYFVKSPKYLSSTFFSKNVAFTEFFPKKCESKLRKFSLILFWQKFREINSITKEVTKELISRNIFSVRENFAFFPHCVVITLCGYLPIKSCFHEFIDDIQSETQLVILIYSENNFHKIFCPDFAKACQGCNIDFIFI